MFYMDKCNEIALHYVYCPCPCNYMDCNVHLYVEPVQNGPCTIYPGLCGLHRAINLRMSKPCSLL